MISYYELLKRIEKGDIPKKIKVHLTSKPKIYKAVYDFGDFNYYTLYEEEIIDDDYKDYLAECFLESDMFDKNIEILDKKKELHANKIVFNCDNNKRECVINLDENDLGIDKLHIDNCYFYKENDKWYVRKYDFKTFNLEEKKIPEKLDIQIQNETTGNAYITNEQGTKCYLTKHSKIIVERLNQVIDYLKSKGE